MASHIWYHFLHAFTWLKHKETMTNICRPIVSSLFLRWIRQLRYYDVTQTRILTSLWQIVIGTFIKTAKFAPPCPILLSLVNYRAKFTALTHTCLWVLELGCEEKKYFERWNSRTSTKLANYVKLGHALDQSCSVQSRGLGRTHQSNKLLWRSSRTNRRLSQPFLTHNRKKVSKTEAGNYRPVSLTSVVCKIIKWLIRDHVVKHMKKVFQHGFMNGRSTVTQPLETLDYWTASLDAGLDVDAIYLDFEKAFDSVPHQRLLRKISSYGLSGIIFKWTKAFLTDRQQKVIVNGLGKCR